MNFNDYRVIDKPIVETGVSVTYPAMYHDLLLGVKLAKETAEDSKMIQSGRVQRTLVHKNIVPVFGWEKDRRTGRPFVITQYSNKQTLSELLLEHEISFGQKTNMLLDVVEALKYSTSRGISHGSVCPSNIFVGREDIALDNFAFLDGNEKKDVYDSALFFFGMMSDESEVSSRLPKKLWWPQSLMPLLFAGLQNNPVNRPSLEEFRNMIESMKAEYSSYLVQLEQLSFNPFSGCPEQLDLGLECFTSGDKEQALNHLSIASRYLKNPIASSKMAELLIECYDLESAFKLVSEERLSSLEKHLMESFILCGSKLKLKGVRSFSTANVSDSVVRILPEKYSKLMKKHTSNEIGIAAVLSGDMKKARKTFESLMEQDSSNVVLNNNLGVVSAIDGKEDPMNYLYKSDVEQAAINRALVMLSRKEFKQAVEEATPARHNPKAAGVIKAVKLNIPALPLDDHPEFSTKTLIDRISSRLSKGVSPSDFEMARTTKNI